MTMRNRIKSFLSERGKTPYQFCKETGIAQRTAYRLYNDEENLPDPVVLTKICRAYNIQPNDVMYWDNSQELKAS